MTRLVECVGSEVIVDTDADETVCPACGSVVRVGGTPRVRRLAIHNCAVMVDAS